MSVTQGSNTLAAIPIIVLASQVSAIMPSNAALGQAIVKVTYNNQTSNPAVVNIVGASPGAFSILTTGFGPGIVQNYVSSTSQPINTTQATAQPGQTMILWGTGLGPVPYADNIAPTAGNLPTQIEMFVGNQPATVAYAGRSPCCAGLDQIVFNVPTNAPAGCYVPVQVRANGAIVSNAVTIAIANNGAPCADSFNPAGAAIRAGGKNGFVQAGRYDYLVQIGLNPPGEVTEDLLFADLRQDAGGSTYFSPGYSLPPGGDVHDVFGKGIRWSRVDVPFRATEPGAGRGDGAAGFRGRRASLGGSRARRTAALWSLSGRAAGASQWSPGAVFQFSGHIHPDDSRRRRRAECNS